MQVNSASCGEIPVPQVGEPLAGGPAFRVGLLGIKGKPGCSLAHNTAQHSFHEEPGDTLPAGSCGTFMCSGCVAAQCSEKEWQLFLLFFFFTLPFFIAVTIAALFLQDKLWKQLEIQQVFCYGFLQTTNTPRMPGAESCRRGCVSSVVLAGSSSFPGSWWGSAPVPSAAQGRGKEGLLAGLRPPKAARLSRAILTCLAEHGSLTCCLAWGLLLALLDQERGPGRAARSH